MLPDVSHRKTPLLLQMMLLYLLTEKSITIEHFPPLHFFLLGGMLSAFFAFLLLFGKIKASLHLIGISALTIFIIGLSLKNQINTINLVAFFVLINGLVASSRLVMKAHSTKELIIGFLCGVLPQIGLFYFWL